MQSVTRAGYAVVGIQNPVNVKQTIRKLGMYLLMMKLPTLRFSLKLPLIQSKDPAHARKEEKGV